MILTTEFDFIKLAISSFQNSQIHSLKDFEEEIRRFSLINTTLNRYHIDKNITRLKVSLNYVVILSNCFGVSSTVDMLRYKINAKTTIETIMYFLNMISETTKLDFELLNLLEEI